ncbi:MAG: hypothetical protein QOH41_2365 [Blastocatellia bacterium]|jgi:hypothetical protein|nr:hypothetical protein [Blastocatellia bacterium]
MRSADLTSNDARDSRDQIGIRQSEIGNRAVLRPTQVQVERELEVLSQIMDNQFRIPVLGWRFGLNAIIDLVPQVGDVATTIIALYVLVSAVRYRVPKITLLRMGTNIAIYFLVGLLPVIGDLFGAWWKPNIRNINLLRRRATVSAADAKQGRASDWLFVALIAGGLLALLFGSMAVMLFFFWYVATHMHLGM